MQLSRLSDSELICQTKQLIKKENEILTKILDHLEEIERRRLFCDFGCSSMFDYCLKELGYSAQQAYRRLNAMRTLKKLPELKPELKSGALSLSNINQASSLFKDAKITDTKQQKEILLDLKNLTKKQGEEKVLQLKSDFGVEEKPKRNLIKNINQETARIHINLSRQTLSKLEKIKGILKDEDLDKIISELADTYLEKKTKISKIKKSEVKVSRFIPKATKVTIYSKANGKCQNCGGVYSLEFDHIKPHAKGGTTSPNNIRLLCKQCNQRAAIKEFGQIKMQEHISGKSCSSGLTLRAGTI